MKPKVVAFVPIKLNSQRLSHKNILPILGKPLSWHIFKTLSVVPEIDEVYVYCSSEKICDYIPSDITLLKRDEKLDGDLVKGAEIYTAFMNEIDADIYILAHTTSPFMKPESIQHALQKILDAGHDSAFSAQKIQTFAWYNNKPINYKLDDVPRTQDMEPIFVETSGFYMFEKDLFLKEGRRIGHNPYIQEVNGIESIDIDTKEDYDFAVSLTNYVEKDV